MDDRNAQAADALVEGVDRRHHVAGAGRRARAVRRIIEMAPVHVDRHHGGFGGIEIVLKALLGVAWLAIDVNLHRSLLRLYRRSSRTCGCPSAPGSWLPRRSLAPTKIITPMVAR